jgi:twinkle protein
LRERSDDPGRYSHRRNRVPADDRRLQAIRPKRRVFLDGIKAQLAPEKDREREPSMLSTKLRERLQFRLGEVTVWAGYNGHRKSMFLGQVCADLLVQKQKVFVMSMEMSPATTFARMARQMSGVEHPSHEWLERWAQWAHRLFAFDYKGTIDPELCLAGCYWAGDKLPYPHIVIDSMMMVVASEDKMDGQKRFMTDLVRFAQEAYAHVHLVAHCRKPSNRDGEDLPPTKYELRGSAAISRPGAQRRDGLGEQAQGKGAGERPARHVRADRAGRPCDGGEAAQRSV